MIMTMWHWVLGGSDEINMTSDWISGPKCLIDWAFLLIGITGYFKRLLTTNKKDRPAPSPLLDSGANRHVTNPTTHTAPEDMCSHLNCHEAADGVSGICSGCSNEDPDGEWHWCYHCEPEPSPYSSVTATDTDTDATDIDLNCSQCHGVTGGTSGWLGHDSDSE